MQTFKQHLDQPQNVGKPGFFQASLRYQMTAEDSVTVYLDVDQKDKIKSFNFEYQGLRGFIPYFSALSVLVKNLTLHQALELSNEDFYDFFDEDEFIHELLESGHIPLIQLPLILLKDAITQYTGDVVVTPAKASELVCRCFGVYESDIKKLIESERSYELIDVIKKTSAGAGCGSCKADVEAIYHEARFTFPTMISLNSKTSTGKVGDLTTAQWVVKIDKVIQDFKNQNGLSELDLELIKFKFPEIRVKIHEKPESLDPEKLKDKLEYFLSQSLQIKVEIKYVV